MGHRIIRFAVLAGGMSVAAATVLASPVTAAPATARPGPAVTPDRLAAAMGTPARTALLLNGDTLTVTDSGAGSPSIAVTTAGSALASTVVSMSFGGAMYEVPADALAYLGHGLDPDLFNVNDLLREEVNGRLPLRVSYHGRRPALPGLTITSHGGGVADGYLTAASARAFGAGLAREYLASHRHGSHLHGSHRADSLGSDALGRRISIGLAGNTAAGSNSAGSNSAGSNSAGASLAPTARPRYVMHTVTVTGTDLTGRPDTGAAVYLINVDNSGVTGNPADTGSTFYDGSAKFSAPSGHYFALADFLDLSGSGALTGERIVTLPQFTVSGNATVHVNEAAASSKVTIVTPRPARTQATMLEVGRIPRTNFPVYFEFYHGDSVPTWVAPTSGRPTIGGLQTYLAAWLTSPTGAARPYEYDLAYRSTGGVPAGRHVVTTANLATIDARYYSPTPTSGYLLRVGRYPFQLGPGVVDPSDHPVEPYYLQEPYIAVHLPQDRIEYTSTGPDLEWTSLLAPAGAAPGEAGTGVLTQYDTARILRRGERATEDWNGGPLHPGVDVNLVGGAFYDSFAAVPSASRSGDDLLLDVTAFSDNTPGHLGFGYGAWPPGTAIGGTYQIDQNGKQIAAGNAAQYGAGSFVALVTLSPRPSTVAFTLDASRTGAAYPVSTRTQTTWTWRSSHQTGTTLPAGWYCGNPGDRDCDVQPMMTLEYSVAGLSLADTARAGRQELTVSAGHLQLARAAGITDAKVQVSFNGGTTWRAARMTGRDGRYEASYLAPASARYVTLLVTAADAAGGRISETITRAYRIAS
jgi:hypothetical protein